ncbi:hypothetical protein H0I23_00935 [Cellulophaga sp. HaHaR_3_176]|uniref:hypothetical protein n=1 Tax=Cellulophaga sp. HaHaR_3_176 TaxID=1942464 RepID=UPI001C1F9067|nr:hypothetical protein [Cellulophaga sp. HaHaR_3_176]QWX84248.1 hypothetical protein H0I23_00935 [Cellulophaga sp. HaHaR_3_176]
MAVLENKFYDKVIAKGKAAVEYIKKGDVGNFFKLSEEAWELFPEPKKNWNQGYNFSKMAFKHAITNDKLDKAKRWLNRMQENNNNLHNFDGECDYYVGLYHFEIAEYERALEIWKEVELDAGLRYFEGDKPEYLDFYLHPEQYIKD